MDINSHWMLNIGMKKVVPLLIDVLKEFISYVIVETEK